MSQTENNKHKFTESSTGLTLSEIKDGVDFPHTGLLKGLLQTGKGNHTVKTGTGNANTDFAITRVSSTRITVKGGSYFRDNKLETISDSGNLDLGYTTAANAYHLLVINEAGAFAIRSPTGVDKVADTDLNDVIVAVLTYAGAGVDMKIQYLTNDKSSNSLSIAHNNAGSGTSTVYTQVGEITGSGAGVNFKVTTGSLTIENDYADGDIIFKGSDSDGTADLTALTLDMSDNGKAYFVGEVSSNGQVLTRNNITNNGNNRILTATTNANEHNAEANMTFDGSNVQLTGSIVATGGLDAGLAVNANTLSSVANTQVGGNLLADGGIINKYWFAQGLVEILDVAHGLIMSGQISNIFIGDVTTTVPANQIVLPAANTVSGRIFTIKSVHGVAVNIIPQGGDLIDSGTPPQSGHSSFLTAANQIDLPPFASITLIALGAEELAPAPLAIGYYILNSTA